MLEECPREHSRPLRDQRRSDHPRENLAIRCAAREHVPQRGTHSVLTSALLVARNRHHGLAQRSEALNRAREEQRDWPDAIVVADRPADRKEVIVKGPVGDAVNKRGSSRVAFCLALGSAIFEAPHAGLVGSCARACPPNMDIRRVHPSSSVAGVDAEQPSHALCVQDIVAWLLKPTPPSAGACCATSPQFRRKSTDGRRRGRAELAFSPSSDQDVRSRRTPRPREGRRGRTRPPGSGPSGLRRPRGLPTNPCPLTTSVSPGGRRRSRPARRDRRSFASAARGALPDRARTGRRERPEFRDDRLGPGRPPVLRKTAGVPPRGFEPLISTLKGWRPRPLDDGGRERRRV